uniref:Uncharacterized protein n=1 Tax=uncultured marine virus TaxID=186617 RepID=A0A0F7L1K4_9VIRU|nr:hypothetical protein [uncultured marine virus]
MLGKLSDTKVGRGTKTSLTSSSALNISDLSSACRVIASLVLNSQPLIFC